MFRLLYIPILLLSLVSIVQAQYIFRYSTPSEGTVALPPPIVSSVSPNNGPTAGGQLVTLSGGNFYNPVVYFGETAAEVLSTTSTQIQVATPAHNWGTVSVSVRNVDGEIFVSPDAYTFSATMPTLSSITPASGSLNGGAVVTLSGSNFLATPRVFFGTEEAAVSYVDTSTVTAVSPEQPAGTVTVTLENPDGKSVAVSNAFQYLTISPTLTSLSPASIPHTGGASVILSGADFTLGTQVLLEGASVGTIYQNSGSVTFTAPSGEYGSTVPVSTLNSDGVSSANTLNLTYHAANPSLTSLFPTSVYTSGGTIIVNGEDFLEGAYATVDGVPSTTAFLSTGQVEVQAPAKTSAGPYAVQVVNPGEAVSSNALTLTYELPAPTVTGLSGGNTSSLSGGGVISVVGENFVAGSRVFIGSLEANILITQPSVITFSVPASSSVGVLDVVVLNPDGKSATLPDAFTYYVYPVAHITSVAPSMGTPTCAGGFMGINGGNFVYTGDYNTSSRLYFNGVWVSTIGVMSSTYYSVYFQNVGACEDNTLRVQVVNPDGLVSNIVEYHFSP